MSSGSFLFHEGAITFEKWKLMFATKTYQIDKQEYTLRVFEGHESFRNGFS